MSYATKVTMKILPAVRGRKFLFLSSYSLLPWTVDLNGAGSLQASMWQPGFSVTRDRQKKYPHVFSIALLMGDQHSPILCTAIFSDLHYITCAHTHAATAASSAEGPIS